MVLMKAKVVIQCICCLLPAETTCDLAQHGDGDTYLIWPAMADAPEGWVVSALGKFFCPDCRKKE